MIYFILPKQPINLQTSIRIVQLVTRQASDRKVVGSIPAQTTGFFGFLFLFPKKEYVRAFSQPETTIQPVDIFGIMRSEIRKKTAPVAGAVYSASEYALVVPVPSYRCSQVGIRPGE